MDYITKYNLTFNLRQGTISIDYKHHPYQMYINKNDSSHFLPVSLSNSFSIPSQSTQLVDVSIPISSTSSPFIPHFNFSHFNPVNVSPGYLHFDNHSTRIIVSNTSNTSQCLKQGTCLGYVYCCSVIRHSRPFHPHLIKSSGSAKSLGARPNLSNDIHPSNNSTSNSFACATIHQLNSSTEHDLNELINNITEPSCQEAVRILLFRFYQLFDTTRHSVANTPIHHVINTVPHSPPAIRPYPQPDKEEVLYHMIQEFLKADLISESHSPYAAPAFLVKKKDGTHRLVVDYKKLNLITIKDSSPLPNMEETIRKLGQGYQYFSKLDLKSGFYQIPIRESDKKKTAFVTPFGLFQFNVLPMGLKNSPPTFQKVMSNTLKSCRSFALVYLDDIIVFSTSYEDHLIHLEKVFTALQDRNFVLNPPKCELFATQINYLGHTISKTIITPMDDKIKAILDMKEPRTLAAANKFIGALSWYRKFLPSFATAAAPIHAVTNLTKTNRHIFSSKFAQSKAFEELKQLLVSKPLFLHYPVDNHPVILTTDASAIGIGGVLQQKIDGNIHNLYYHSQLMTPTERKYSTIEKEALAIFKCFVRMRPLLLGKSIIIMTDHCPLCHIMTKTVKNARVDRIANLIQEYNIEQVLHISGRHNCLPDFLSRFPRELDDDLFDIEYGLDSKNESQHSTSSTANILAHMVLRPRVNNKVVKDIVVTDSSTSSIDQNSSLLLDTNSQSHSTKSCVFTSNYFDLVKLKDEQQKDKRIHYIIEQLRAHQKNIPFVLKGGILYKLHLPSRSSKSKIRVIYLPSSMIRTLLYAIHDDPMSGGHFSFERTYHKLKHHYWWPDMKQSIRRHIQSCLLCCQYNTNRQKKQGRLRSITPPEGPFQMIGIDYCGPLKRTPRDNQYVLVITDYFTRHVSAISLPNCTADITAESLFNEYFCKYGIPSVILSDRGPHFNNQLMSNITRLIGYNHIYSTPYHPQTNGIVERFNSTFVSQLSKLQDSEHNNWDEYLQAIVFAYNSGVHKTTKYSPYELLYSRPPRLPIHPPPSHFSFSKPSNYFGQLQKTLKIYHQFARNNILQQQERNKVYYDRNRSDPHFVIGDKVLTRVTGGKGKLDPLYSSTPKVIIQTAHPIYIVQDEVTKIESQVHVSDLRPLRID